MKTGINLLLWTIQATPAHAPQFRAIKAAGFDGVELPTMEGDPAAYRAVGAVLDDLGLGRTACMALVDPGCDPSSADAAKRRAGRDELRRQIERTHAAGARILIGPMYQALGCFTGQGPTADERKRAAEVVREAAADAAAAGITLAVEPLNRFEAHLVNTLEDAAAFVRLVDHPSVGAMYDSFHANIEEQDPVGCIRRHGAGIRHVHVCANDRGIPGRDHLDWPGTFAALRDVGYDGWYVVEAFGRALPGLAAATRIWRDLFPSADDVIRESLAFLRKHLARA